MTARPIKHIAHVVATLDRAGTEMVCLALMKALASQDVQSSVTALRRGAGGIAPEMSQIAGRVRVLPPHRLSRFWVFYRHLQQTRPDAVILHFFTADHVLLGAAARLAGIRRILAVQGNPPAGDPALGRRVALILWASRWFGLGLVSASAEVERAMALLGKLPRCAAVIHNGCDTAAIAARAAQAPGPSCPDLVILMIARLDPIKDHRTLLQALALMPERIAGRRVALWLAGEGSCGAALRQQAAALGVAPRVAFLGRRADIPELLAKANLFCLSTTAAEGFGIVLIEALAAGCPVIASDVPACREVLRDGALGRLVPPGDAAALARALTETLCTAPPPVPAGQVARLYDQSVMARAYLRALAAPFPSPARRFRVFRSTSPGRSRS